MGIFSSGQKASAETVYTTLKKFLKQKDGKIYVVMINSFSKFLNQVFGCEDKYTIQIDEIVGNMQNDGYEIVDIKFSSLTGQGLTGNTEGFHRLILYK